MKETLKHLLACALLAMAGAAHAHDDHPHTPLHGGVVAEASDMDFELVIAADAIRLHVRDHGKPVAVAGATARLVLLIGSEKRELALQSAGDRLEARGSFEARPGTKAVATVQLSGRKPVNVRFALK